MAELENRLEAIESRLGHLEELVQMIAQGGKKSEPVKLVSASGIPQKMASPIQKVEVRQTQSSQIPKQKSEDDSSSVTNLLGWTGATALVFAAVYLIRLAIDSGWLTPERQIVIALLSSLSLIVAGLWLRKIDRSYASLLPASGVVVLFLSIYGAHNYYHLIPANVAAGAVVTTCIAALWLGRLFESELYALFAVVGSYSAPFLLPNLAETVTDLVVYYTAWSVLFSIYSVRIGQRRIYLLAAYMALLGFNTLWLQLMPNEWFASFVFQSVQFIVFLGAAISFSILHNSAMNEETGLLHLPLLLIFYAMQYWVLHKHVPALASWIAVGSAGVLLVGYLIAKQFLDEQTKAGSLLVGAYVAIVLFHAVYMESVPTAWEPWLALAMLPIVAIYLLGGGESIVWPIKLLIGLVFLINYLRVLFNFNLNVVPAHNVLAFIYAIQLYAAYFYARQLPALKEYFSTPLYAGHIALMSAFFYIFDGRFAVSFAWGTIAISCLMISIFKQDRVLGTSSLLIFAISAAKVLLFDLSGAAPLVRIACLVVLGITLYAGGWLYRKVDKMEPA